MTGVHHNQFFEECKTQAAGEERRSLRRLLQRVIFLESMDKDGSTPPVAT
jgi:hypothetical protein